MTVCVKRVLDGRGSNWFNDALKVGSIVESRGPAGRFTLDSRQADLLVIAGGSGITPCISLIKQALFETHRNIRLIYANQNSESIIYLTILNLLRKRFPDRFGCYHWLDDNNGFMRSENIISLTKGFETASCYICGPAQLMDMAEETLSDCFGQTATIKTERFISPPDAIEDKENFFSDEFEGEQLIAEFRLQFEGKTHTISLAAGQTLLQAALDFDLDIPHSCTEGHCGACMGKLVEGQVSMSSTKALSKRNIERGNILLCQSHPSADMPLLVNLDF